MEKKNQWNTGYWIVALLLLLSLQSYWQTAKTVEPVPYSEFEKALDEGRVAEVLVSDRTVTGRLKSPDSRGKTTIVATRVEPDLADRLSKKDVPYARVLESTWPSKPNRNRLKSQSTNFNQEPKIMNIKQPQYTFSALALAVVVGLSGPALAQSAAGSSPGAAAPSAASKAAQPQVDDKAAREADKKRAELTQDAITALTKTQEALTLLDANKTKEALAALELASGKLELVLARDAKLALAPVDVRVITHDIHANVESVKKAVKLSRELLGDGEVQKARPIVANLASEIVIQTDNLPMATYPAAIKSAARLIDSGKIDNAKAELARALNTLVVTSVAFPLPVLRAEAAMAKAEKLAETDRRDAKQNEELSTLLSSVRTEIEMAQILGYGKKADFKPIFDQVKSIEQKSAGGKSGKGWFDELKTRIQKLF